MSAVLALMLFATGALTQETVPKELAALQGKWQIVTVNGEPMNPADPGAAFTITADKYVQGPDDAPIERGTLKIDRSKPRQIDLVITAGESAGSTQPGIYEVTGDTLRFHLAMPGGAERPKDFTPREGFLIITAKKQT